MKQKGVVETVYARDVMNSENYFDAQLARREVLGNSHVTAVCLEKSEMAFIAHWLYIYKSYDQRDNLQVNFLWLWSFDKMNLFFYAAAVAVNFEASLSRGQSNTDSIQFVLMVNNPPLLRNLFVIHRQHNFIILILAKTGS